MWNDLLGVSPIGTDDDFFELGGHSLIAIRLMSRIHKQLGVRLRIGNPVRGAARSPSWPTSSSRRTGAGNAGRHVTRNPLRLRKAPRRAARLDSCKPPETLASRTRWCSCATGGDETALFIVHGAGGNVLNLWGLAKRCPRGDRSTACKLRGIDGSVPPDNSVERMASATSRDPAHSTHGPYLLGGYSGGGVVALEMSRCLPRAAIGCPASRPARYRSKSRLVPSLRRALLYAVENAVRSGPSVARALVAVQLVGCRVLAAGRETLDSLDALNLGLGRVEQFGFVNLWTHFTEVAQRYEFTRYDVDVIVAKAQKVFPGWPWHYKWRGKVTGSIDTVIVPGDHYEMFTTENAPVLAASSRRI
jgi:thioesterase domain-containing protein